MNIKQAKSVTQFSIVELVKISRPVSWLAVAMPFLVGRIMATGQIDVFTIWVFVYLTLPFGLLGRLAHFLPWTKHLASVSAEKLTISAKIKRQFLWTSLALNLLFLTNLLAQGTLYNPLLWLGLLSLTLIKNNTFLATSMAGFLRVFVRAITLALPLLLGLSSRPIVAQGWYILLAFFVWQLANQLFRATAHQQVHFPTLLIKLKLSLRRLTSLSMWLFVSVSLILLLGFGKKVFIVSTLLLLFALNVSFYRRFRSYAHAKRLLKGYRDQIWLCYIIGTGVLLNLLWWWTPASLHRPKITSLMIIIMLVGLLQIVILVYNLIHFKRPKTAPLPEWPRLSIILHTFNQADSINSTLLSLIGQNYPHYEIIIADLDSTDNTKKIIKSYHDKKIKILDVGTVPSDWTIENWASQQLLEAATGSIVVSISADTVMLPNALTNIASLVTSRRYDIIALLPAEQNKSLAQKFILNHNHYFMLGTYPSAYIYSKNMAFAPTLSHVMAFDRAIALDMGGFGMIKKHPIQDLALPLSMREHSAKTGFFLGSDIVLSQNNASWRQIIRQNIQLFYPALHFDFPLSSLVIIGGFFMSFSLLVGTIMAIIGILSPIILVLAYLANLLPRLVVARISRQSMIAILLYPITGLAPLVMLFLSIIGYEIFRPSQLLSSSAKVLH